MKQEDVVLYLSSTSNHNHSVFLQEITRVVLYLSSTSNHNLHKFRLQTHQVVLYLSSTSNHNAELNGKTANPLCYIFLLHQTTTLSLEISLDLSCVISFFYIKPQPKRRNIIGRTVVLYLSSTSNHNSAL